MGDEETNDLPRRTFVKGAAATGVAATGVAAFSGTASAQQVGEIDSDNLVQGNSLVSITVQDAVDVAVGNLEVNILSPDGNQTILSDIRIRDVQVVNVEDNTVVITVENVLNRIQANVSQVVVQLNVLSAGNVVDQAQDTAFLIQ